MKKFLLALFFTAFALTGAHAQPAQQSPAQPDVKPTILDPVANKRVGRNFCPAALPGLSEPVNRRQ